SLLVLCFLPVRLQSYGHIIAALLSLLVATMATIALIGQGFGSVAHSILPGIEMSSHAALGLLLVSLSLLILFYTSAIAAFNRMGFFYRLAIAFGFMTVLFLGSGSTALIQIGNISTIINDLYRNPLQIDKAAEDITEEVGFLNRKLKDIAINPELLEPVALAEYISASQARIAQHMLLIGERSELASGDLKQLELGITHWYQLIDRKSTRLNSSHVKISYAVFCSK